MKPFHSLLAPILLGAVTLSLIGCHGSHHSSPPPATNNSAYTVGGNVMGLTEKVVLQNNGTDDLTLTTNGLFAFPRSLQQGDAYAVSIKTQPVGETCVVTQGTGFVTAAVNNVSIACAANAYTVGGTISGLVGTVVLQNSDSDDQTISTDGAFTFPTPVVEGAPFSVKVVTQPTGYTCTVGGGSGIMGSGKVSSVSVVCSANSYAVGGTVSGLSGSVVVQNNGGDLLTLQQDGRFTFPTLVANGGNYTVTVHTQPPTQTCTVSNGHGAVGASEITDLAVVCSTNTFAVGGVASGLLGSVTLQNNAGDNLTINADGVFTFAMPVAEGSAYQVTVLSQPTTQTCTVANGSGTVGATSVTNVNLVCTDSTTALSVAAVNVIPVGGGLGTVTVTNIGTLNTATNIRADLPPGWTAVTQDASSCASLAPGSSCTLSFQTFVPYVAQGGIAVTGDNVSSPPSMTLGFSIDGYLVFAVDSSSTASVVDTTDISFSEWAVNLGVVGSSSLTDGAANTAQIVAALGATPNPAASCNSSTAGGATAGTWYLPAVCQMGLPGQGAACPAGLPNIENNLHALGLGNFDDGYWSSTEFSDFHAWLVTMTAGGSGEFTTFKYSIYPARCVRSMPY